ncbi:MAG: HipA domain-containing protein [Lachnospiraceae bacterium]
MKDFSFWEEYEGASEGSGRSEKIWLQNPDTGQTGLFKFKKDVGTTDHVSECIAYEIAQLLEIPCAKFELGMYHGREGSMSYNIIENSNQILAEGIYFITLIYPEYNPEQFIDVVTKHRYSIEMVKKAIEKFVSIESFLKMLVFDYLIGNSDRHQNNWAIIIKNDKMEWSPLYDNSSSLCAYILEEQIAGYLGKDKNRWNSLIDTKSRSLLRCKEFDEKRPTHLMVMKYLKENYFGETCGFVKKIVTVMTEKQIYDILKSYLKEELSDNKKKLISKYLLEKKQMLRTVYFGEEE